MVVFDSFDAAPRFLDTLLKDRAAEHETGMGLQYNNYSCYSVVTLQLTLA